jgi:DNA-binding response OmpR family regulator
MNQAQQPSEFRPVILIVDDEQDLVDILADALSLSIPDHEVITTTSFDDAQRLLEQLKQGRRQLSLLLVDQEIGDHSGLEVIDESRTSFPECAHLLYTGRAQQDMVDKAISYGAKVLWKPQRLKVLIQEIRALL